MKKRVYEILEVAGEGDKTSRIIDIFIVVLIILNVIAVILETESGLKEYHKYFRIFDIFSIIIFTIEYLLRVWSSGTLVKYCGFKGKIKFIFTPMALIDLIAIIPFYIPILLPLDLRFLRAFRVMRIFRLLKLVRYSKALQGFGRILKSKKEELVITLFSIFILLIVSSSLMYYAEHNAQPEKYSSILSSMWWGIISLTTVGYGDVYPITVAGKILNGFIAILGIGVIALPAGILASGFSEETSKKK